MVAHRQAAAQAPTAGAAQAPAAGRSTILVLISALAGLVTYTMGLSTGCRFDGSTAGDDLSRWGEGRRRANFFSYEVLLNPGKFLILMGALAVAAALLVVPASSAGGASAGRARLRWVAGVAVGGAHSAGSSSMSAPVRSSPWSPGFLQAAALVQRRSYRFGAAFREPPQHAAMASTIVDQRRVAVWAPARPRASSAAP